VKNNLTLGFPKVFKFIFLNEIPWKRSMTHESGLWVADNGSTAHRIAPDH
jgi:hypothetical protein